MKQLTTVTCTAALLCISGFAFQQTSPGQSSPSQNSQDVPTGQPGTSNPDVGKQRHPTPASPGTGTSQQHADVPEDQPGTNNPDVGKQRHPTAKKNKHSKSTGSSTQSSTT